MLGSLMWVLCKYFEKEGGGCVFASTEEDKGGLMDLSTSTCTFWYSATSRMYIYDIVVENENI